MLLAVLVLLFSLNGCFVIGTAVGASVANKQHAKRPVIKPELDLINELEAGTWVDLVRKDGKIIEGKYVEAIKSVEVNGDTIPIIKIKMAGKRANQMIMLKDIDHVAIGYKSDGPKWLGTGLGLIIDGIVFTILAVKLNNAISP